MKSPSDCLEEIQNGEHEKYPYTLTLTDFIEPEILEQMIQALCQAAEVRSDKSVELFGYSLADSINFMMSDRALTMSQASVTPLDNDTNEADIKKEM